ncbi:RNA polymerase sigma factor SigJ [Isoptericola variabilis]|uniref:RNA polymerase, sigma-24 subunit, ECF subfamily n=1 Tax=Isoptericola variabilis (strain 225) TaxID=743718 RepID=F6FVE3_ISOV2|nr:RNA polymerase sigma factor SigJ [Isoptericola variabilis]AEG44370.1 RNA polymerase, sigma-24 subunit, ECF subfamily [Isoptericola variabilis 225]TWH34363.1 RNA polymerase sigma-70 factor (ECF subfamily) [Isoptericola variabilis J7]
MTRHHRPRTARRHRPTPSLTDLRRVAFAAAYRMLGSVTEAEDVAQEALLRVAPQGEVADDVVNAEAYTTTVATRIALDVLRSARVRRESYVGEWLPEPLVGDVVASGAAPPDGAAHAELADDLSTAFLVLLETLTPSERAAFLLHDVLGYPHRQAARVIGTTELAARQLVSRARRRVAARREEMVDDARGAAADRPDPHAAELVERFIAAVERGELEALLELLAEDVEIVGDSGGNTPPGFAVSKPVRGREAVARLLVGFARRGAPGHLRPALVNGRPGMVAYADESIGGGLIGTYALDVSGGRVTHLRGVINPDKLRHLGPLADLDAVARVIRDVAARRRAASDAPPA